MVQSKADFSESLRSKTKNLCIILTRLPGKLKLLGRGIMGIFGLFLKLGNKQR